VSAVEVLPADAWTPQYAAEHVIASWRDAVESIIETGRRLIEAKARVGHGHWQDTVALLPFGDSTARKLMQIAAHPDLANRDHATDLPASWYTLSVLAQLPPGEIPERIAAGEITPELDRATAQQWANFYGAARQEALTAWSAGFDALTAALAYVVSCQPPASIPSSYPSPADWADRVGRLSEAVREWEGTE
jgi:hypothetical protein